jgi:predicted PurR-regulated permease PerM
VAVSELKSEERPETEQPGCPGDDSRLALHALVATGVAIAVLATAVALWQARAVVLLLFLSYTLAAAIRPTVERLVQLRFPRWLAVGVHLLAATGIVALLLWLFVPTAMTQTQSALADLPASTAQAADEGTLDSFKRRVLVSLQSQLRDLPSPEAAFSTAVRTLAILAGIAFTIASAVYWLSERDRVVRTALSVVPLRKRQTIQDAWLLVDLRLGAVIRTKLLLVAITGTILSTAFWLIGVPYFLLVGAFAGIVEIVPVIGPLIAGLTAVAAGLTVSWQTALAAALAVYGLRILQDYVINPRLFGRAVHLPPLVVLLAVSAIALLLGPFWVPLAIPITAVLSTLVDVILRQADPADEPVPSVLVRTDKTVGDRRPLGTLRDRLGGRHGA